MNKDRERKERDRYPLGTQLKRRLSLEREVRGAPRGETSRKEERTMKRRANILAMVGAVLAIGFCLWGVEGALAEEDGSQIVRGQGSVCAAGHGVIQFHGSGTVIATVDAGQLILNDEDAVVEIRGDGIRHRFPNGWVLYQGFHGKVRLEGEDLFGQVIGKGLRMRAEGEGVMLLAGKGVYRSPCGGAAEVSWKFFNGDGLGVELGNFLSGSEGIGE